MRSQSLYVTLAMSIHPPILNLIEENRFWQLFWTHLIMSLDMSKPDDWISLDNGNGIWFSIHLNDDFFILFYIKLRVSLAQPKSRVFCFELEGHSLLLKAESPWLWPTELLLVGYKDFLMETPYVLSGYFTLIHVVIKSFSTTYYNNNSA